MAEPDDRMPRGDSGQPMLPREVFAEIVRLTPLVSIDLIARNPRGEILLGWRRNRPARASWFVPGGRIGKNERIAAAFVRIAQAELGLSATLGDGRFLGAFEHLYPDNFAGEPGYGTHYVVLAYLVPFDGPPHALPRTQHVDYLWLAPSDAVAHPDVHENSKVYARLLGQEAG